MKILPPTPAGLEEAAAVLRAGKIVAYPTEAVYGLAVDPFSPIALRKLFRVKGRKITNPILLIVSDEEQLQVLATKVSPEANAYINAYWPGPLSLVFKKTDRVPIALTGTLGKVCVRCPSCKIARDLCQAFRGPLTSTSANHSGKTPARSVAEIRLPDVTVAIDGGTLAKSIPSTIYDPDTHEMLREGPVTPAMLNRVLAR